VNRRNISIVGIPVDHSLRDTVCEVMKLNETRSNSSPPPATGKATTGIPVHASVHIGKGVNFACCLAVLAVQGGIIVASTQQISV
jgi:hypothetical protein